MTKFAKATASSSFVAVPSCVCRKFSIFNNSGGLLKVSRADDTANYCEVLDGRSLNDISPQVNADEFAFASATGTGVVSFVFDEIAN